ncbi:DUF2239 family protein [bacterium]|nr:DUF2239 family protein [bacterium]
MVFAEDRCIARGETLQVAREMKEYTDRNPDASIMILDEADARIVEIDFRGDIEDVLARLEERAAEANMQKLHNGGEENMQKVHNTGAENMQKVHQTTQRGPGRPKLGVVSREVTLLPRHWEWLSSQPGGASVTLRKLVEAARKDNSGRDRMRRAQDITYRFMNALGGDLSGYEEALRALYADDRERFAEYIADWPADIREHSLRFSAAAFS